MAGDEWKVRAAGLGCVIGYERGQWRVTVADVTESCGPELAAAIVEAFGGLLEREAARGLAESVERRRETSRHVASRV
jgi:hypothetical protein